MMLVVRSLPTQRAKLFYLLVFLLARVILGKVSVSPLKLVNRAINLSRLLSLSLSHSLASGLVEEEGEEQYRPETKRSRLIR